MKLWKLAIVVLAVGMFSVSAVAQDTCATAIDLDAVGATLDPCVDDVDAGGPLPGDCIGGGGVMDVWGYFVATGTSAVIRTDLNSTGTDSDFMVYSGTCGSLTDIGCSEDECYNYPGRCIPTASDWLGNICVSGLTNGETYYIQMGTYGDYCPNGPYVVDFAYPAPGVVCGDGVLSCVEEGYVGYEECDGTEGYCESGECAVDCTCVPVTPALPVWGVIGLGVLLVGGGATAVARRRKKA